jgi:hypothetical protein
MVDHSVKQYHITDLLTTAEIDRAMILFCECKKTKDDFSKRCAKEVVEPVISRVKACTGYSNTPEYLAHCLAHYLELAYVLKSYLTFVRQERRVIYH